jgi:sugar phosphate permease
VTTPHEPPTPAAGADATAPADAAARPARRVGNVRWAIAVLLFFGVLVNYFDRTNISVAAGPMGEEFGLTPGELGIVLSSFLWSYTLSRSRPACCWTGSG